QFERSGRMALEQRGEAEVAEHHRFAGAVADLSAHGQPLLKEGSGTVVLATPKEAVAEVVQRRREPQAVPETARDRGVLLMADDSAVNVTEVAERNPELVQRKRGATLIAKQAEELETRFRGATHPLVVADAVCDERRPGQRLRTQRRRRVGGAP